MLETPQFVQTEPMATAYIPIRVPRAEIGSVMGPGLGELMGTLAQQGVKAAGAWFSRHLQLDAEFFVFELSVPVTAPITPTGRVVAGYLPTAPVAQVTYCGDYAGLGEAWESFDQWIVGQGKIPGSDMREIYLVGPASSPRPADWRTVLVRTYSEG